MRTWVKPTLSRTFGSNSIKEGRAQKPDSAPPESWFKISAKYAGVGWRKQRQKHIVEISLKKRV